MVKRAGPATPPPTAVVDIAQWARQPPEGPTDVPLGERIKQLRKERKWSQGELAAQIGADAGQISRYENGHIAPSADGVARLAQALDVSCDYLLIDGAPRRALHPSENILGDRLDGLTELPPDDLTALLNVIDGLVAKTRLKALAGGIS
jgi:transcriptional regulator with XRE-family HTH domain